MKFRLIGNTTLFIVERFYDAAGFLPSVIGKTTDGKKQTVARIKDVIFV